jgi:hypothetical protein
MKSGARGIFVPGKERFTSLVTAVKNISPGGRNENP